MRQLSKLTAYVGSVKPRHDRFRVFFDLTPFDDSDTLTRLICAQSILAGVTQKAYWLGPAEMIQSTRLLFDFASKHSSEA
jgi:hypothetical protein